METATGPGCTVWLAEGGPDVHGFAHLVTGACNRRTFVDVRWDGSNGGCLPAVTAKLTATGTATLPVEVTGFMRTLVFRLRDALVGCWMITGRSLVFDALACIFGSTCGGTTHLRWHARSAGLCTWSLVNPLAVRFGVWVLSPFVAEDAGSGASKFLQVSCFLDYFPCGWY